MKESVRSEMKILTVVSNAVPNYMGGELRVALDLSKGYIENGHKCEILTFGKKTENMHDIICREYLFQMVRLRAKY